MERHADAGGSLLDDGRLVGVITLWRQRGTKARTGRSPAWVIKAARSGVEGGETA